jgi:FixJ family two-component response regulator
VKTPRKTVLVVDDDPGMLKGVARLLNAHGFDTETFDSAEALLNSANPADRANCILLDIHLSGMSGIELRRQLATSECRLPVIFMTGNDTESTRKEALEAGCIAYLRKPFPAEALMSAIEKALA